MLPKGFDSSFYTQQAIPLDDLDLTNGKPAGVSHLVRAETINLVNQIGGKVSFRVNTGLTGEIFRVWVGNACVFSSGGLFGGSDHLIS